MICAESSNMSDEKRLIKRLLNDYERVGVVGRPVHNQSQTIHVNYGLALIQILDLDEKNQVLTTNVWSRYVSTSVCCIFFVIIIIISITISVSSLIDFTTCIYYCTVNCLLFSCNL